MKQQTSAHSRAIAMLMAAVALPFTPAFAQEPTNAPPVAATTAPPTPPVSAPEPVAPPVATQPPVFAPTAPVVQAIPVRPTPPPEPVAEAAPVATPRAASPRPAPRAETRTAIIPAASAPITPAPDAVEPQAAPAIVDTLPSTIPEPQPEPAAAVAPEAVDTTPWSLIIIGIVALGAIIIGMMLARRRSRRTVERPAYVAPYSDAEVQQPIAPVQRAPVAPIVPKSIMRELLQPIAPKPVAPVVATTGERPWIGLSLAPICAGTTEGGTMVQYELIVENTSDVPAQDVRITSFMIDGARSSAAEQAMINPLGEPQSQTVDIMAGSSVPITTTIRVDRSDLTGDTFMPKIVAEARYPLPGGGEGHFAARFAIGIAAGDAIKPVSLRNGDGMHDDVGAKFDDVLESV